MSLWGPPQFPYIQGILREPAQSKAKKIATAAYLAGATRNQVQHQVDTGMVIFRDREAAVDTVDALLSLCRLDGWVA